MFCRNIVVWSCVKPSFNPFHHCVVWCYAVILMIICACISAPGISVRVGWFRRLCLINSFVIKSAFSTDKFHCGYSYQKISTLWFSLQSELCKVTDVSKKDGIQSRISMGKKKQFIKFSFHDKSNQVVWFCICHTINGFELFLLYVPRGYTFAHVGIEMIVAWCLQIPLSVDSLLQAGVLNLRNSWLFLSVFKML